MNWEDISREVEEKFELKIFRTTLRDMYTNYVTKANVITNQLQDGRSDAKEVMIDWNKRLMDKFIKIDELTNKLINFMDKLLDESLEEDNKAKYVKLIPTALAVCNSILNQLTFVKRQQEQIIISQKNVIYSPLQIMREISKISKRQVRNNEIKVIEKRTGKVKEGATNDEKKEE